MKTLGALLIVLIVLVVIVAVILIVYFWPHYKMHKNADHLAQKHQERQSKIKQTGHLV